MVERERSEQDDRKMGVKICIPIVGVSMDQFIGNMRSVQGVAKFIELRTDFVEGLKPQNISQIKHNVNRESIFTCRRSDEGGKFQGSEEERVAILKEALSLGFDYIDIELSTLQERRLDLSSRGKTKVIVSYHNFEGTPEEDTIRKIIQTMKKHQPDIIKIATQIVRPEDNDKLFRLMLDETLGLPRIIIGMGELGKITRVFGPVVGSYLTYASTDDQETAPGQIDINNMRKIYRLIGVME